jgi:hypothetical protein
LCEEHIQDSYTVDLTRLQTYKIVLPPQTKPRRGGGLRQINTCRQVPLLVNFYEKPTFTVRCLYRYLVHGLTPKTDQLLLSPEGIQFKSHLNSNWSRNNYTRQVCNLAALLSLFLLLLDLLGLPLLLGRGLVGFPLQVRGGDLLVTRPPSRPGHRDR